VATVLFGVSGASAAGLNDPLVAVRLTPLSAAPTAILRPGAVNRTSVDLDATYAVNLAVRYGDRGIRMNAGITISNTSGGPIDRVELNTVAARLGAMTMDRVSVNNRIVRATVSDQTILVPLGGILDPGASVDIRVIFHATLRTTTAGSDWLFTRSGGVIDLYRVVPWVSLRHPFGRVNQGDPFVTANSRRVDLVLITDRPMVAAVNARRLSVSADGKTQTFTTANVRDIPMTLSPDYRGQSLDARLDRDPRLHAAGRSAGSPDGRGAPVAPARGGATGAVSVAAIHRRRDARRLPDGGARRDLDSACRRAGEPALHRCP
jgi:hypothetical protein